MADFPETLYSADDLFIAANKATSLLSAGITDVEMSLTVVDGSKFPTGRFSVSIGAEIMVIASRALDVLTIEERGAEGTVAAAHLVSTIVNSNFTAGHWNKMTDALVRIQRPLKLLREPVVDSTLADPPAGPTDLDQYVVGTPATGAWTGQEATIARWESGAWIFITPDVGTLVYDQTADSYLMFGSLGWDEFGGGGDAIDVLYDNTTSGATAANVQAVIDELFFNVSALTQFEINLSLTGGTRLDELLGDYVATKSFNLPINFAGSQGTCTATPDVTEGIDVRKNGVSIGTVVVTANAVTFTAAAAASFVSGDTLSFKANGDAAFDALSFTLVASRP